MAPAVGVMHEVVRQREDPDFNGVGAERRKHTQHDAKAVLDLDAGNQPRDLVQEFVVDDHREGDDNAVDEKDINHGACLATSLHDVADRPAMVEDVRLTIAESGRGIHKVFESTNPALLIIDMQQAIDSFSKQVRSNPAAEAVVESLLLRWRERELPVVHVRHASKYPASPYHDSAACFAFKPELAPREDEAVITKQENCAFIATDLEQVLR